MLNTKFSFVKFAKKLISNIEAPPIPKSVTENQNIRDAVYKKTQGASPTEHRNKLTSNWAGIIQRNAKSQRAG